MTFGADRDLPPHPDEHRTFAAALVADARSRRPDLVRWRGVDLGPALEQAIFAEMRWGALFHDPDATRVRSAAGTRSQRLRLIIASLAPTLRQRSRTRGRPVALVLGPMQERIMAEVNAELDRRGAIQTLTLSDGWGLFGSQATQPRSRLVDCMGIRDWVRLAPELLRMLHGFGSATAGWTEVLGSRASIARIAGRQGLARAMVHAARLDAMMVALRPPLVVAFDESGLWARVLPAVAERRGLPTLDLPHSDMIHPDEVKGAGYTMLAVFGSEAAARLRQAGVSSDRIVEIGAPRFDELVRLVKTGQIGSSDRRVVVASQLIVGDLTDSVKRGLVDAAIGVAVGLAPAELVVVPHPLETDSINADEFEARHLPAGVTVRLAPRGALYTELPGASALVTAWSTSVYEAAIAGVPAITFDPREGPDGSSFAAEGLAIAVGDAHAGMMAGARLRDETERARQVSRARTAVTRYVGPVDGRATERAADLIIKLSRA